MKKLAILFSLTFAFLAINMNQLNGQKYLHTWTADSSIAGANVNFEFPSPVYGNDLYATWVISYQSDTVVSYARVSPQYSNDNTNWVDFDSDDSATTTASGNLKIDFQTNYGLYYRIQCKSDSGAADATIVDTLEFTPTLVIKKKE